LLYSLNTFLGVTSEGCPTLRLCARTLIKVVDGTSGKTSASGAGGMGMGFKSRSDQISHTLPTTVTAATLKCKSWRKVAEKGTAHSWHPKGYLASILKIWFNLYADDPLLKFVSLLP